MVTVGERVWLFLSKTDELTSSMGMGYEDVTGLYYSYDSNVAQSRKIRVGDIVVVREDEFAAGWGVIEHIDVVPNQFKIILRCPQCMKSRPDFRKTKFPAYRCTNKSCLFEFDRSQIVETPEQVTSFRAHFANTWIDAARPIHFHEFEELQLSSSTFNAIRPLDPSRIQRFLDRLSGRDVEISSEFTEKEIEILLGGHTNVVVRRRRGQRAFRFALMQRYGERCAFSGAQPPQVLEAAHIYRFADRPEHRSDGGLLLRRDCHALFDANLIAVNPHTLKIEVAPVLERYPTYQKLKDAPLQVQEASMPSLELIESHYRQSLTVFANN